MTRPAVRDRLVAARDEVLVAEARAADVDAARVHGEALVEARRGEVARVRLDRERLETPRLEPG